MGNDLTDITKFLFRFAPASYIDVLGRHPEDEAALKAQGVALGFENKAAAVDAAQSMLVSVSNVVRDATTSTGRRLRTISRVQLFGSLAGLASSGGAVSIGLAKNSVWWSAGLAGIAFVVNAVPLITRWLLGTISGEGTIAQHFGRLSELSWAADELLARLRNAGDDELPALIGKANDIAHEAYMLLVDLNYQPSFHPV